MKKSSSRKKIIFFSLAAVLFLLLSAWLIWSNSALELNRITVSGKDIPETFNGFTIAHVSDLHNASFGEDNSKLLNLLRQAQPNIIAVTGDLIDSRRTDVDTAAKFMEAAVDIAPVYYVTGNHEGRVFEEYSQLENQMTAAGVTILHGSSCTISLGVDSVCIAGLDDPNFSTADMESTLSELMSGELYSVLLSHRPEFMELYSRYEADLVLSGHAHGGQIRLPFLGGLVAPGQGLLPKYDSGLYTHSGTNMVVSRGLGNSLFPLRVNNRPEVVLIELSVE